MKQIILIITFLLTNIFCFAQKQHLNTTKEFDQYEGDLKEYYENVFSLLHKEYSKNIIARYTSIPSFSSEYSFSIETIDDKKYIVSAKLSENYWYAKNRESIKLISNKTELSNDLYLKIIELFKVLDEQTKNQENVIVGLDGETYYFATIDNNGQIKVGETWSPDENSLFGRLIKICDIIYTIGNGKNLSQIELIADIDKLLIELKQ